MISIATPENEGELLDKTKILPKPALEAMVRDFKVENGMKSVPGHMNAPGFSGKSSGDNDTASDLNLSPEILQKLFELQNKGIDLNQLLAQFLEERDRRIEEEKQAIVEEDRLRAEEAAAEGKRNGQASRYVRARTKNVLKQEFGTKCAIPHCPKHSSPLHHTDRFSLSGANNPYYLAPLCKNHHILAHSVDRKFQQKRQEAVGATP